MITKIHAFGATIQNGESLQLYFSSEFIRTKLPDPNGFVLEFALSVGDHVHMRQKELIRPEKLVFKALHAGNMLCPPWRETIQHEVGEWVDLIWQLGGGNTMAVYLPGKTAVLRVANPMSGDFCQLSWQSIGAPDTNDDPTVADVRRTLELGLNLNPLQFELVQSTPELAELGKQMKTRQPELL